MPERVRVPVLAHDKAGVIRELTQLLVDQSGGVFEDVLEAVHQREAMLSTGIGHGVAIPHGKSPTLRGLSLVCGSSRVAVPFDALDGQPVRLFFLLAGPEAASTEHVRALSRIARIVRRPAVRDRLLHAGTPAEFHRVLLEAERL